MRVLSSALPLTFPLKSSSLSPFTLFFPVLFYKKNELKIRSARRTRCEKKQGIRPSNAWEKEGEAIPIPIGFDAKTSSQKGSETTAVLWNKKGHYFRMFLYPMSGAVSRHDQPLPRSLKGCSCKGQIHHPDATTSPAEILKNS
jgi:hypothetical protein